LPALFFAANSLGFRGYPAAALLSFCLSSLPLAFGGCLSSLPLALGGCLGSCALGLAPESKVFRLGYASFEFSDHRLTSYLDAAPLFFDCEPSRFFSCARSPFGPSLPHALAFISFPNRPIGRGSFGAGSSFLYCSGRLEPVLGGAKIRPTVLDRPRKLECRCPVLLS